MKQNGHRHRRAGRDTVKGGAGQAGLDIRVADREGEVGVSVRQEVVYSLVERLRERNKDKRFQGI